MSTMVRMLLLGVGAAGLIGGPYILYQAFYKPKTFPKLWLAIWQSTATFFFRQIAKWPGGAAFLFRVARKHMVEEQIFAQGIHDPRVLAAIASVPRHRFVLPDDLPWAYSNGPLQIDYGQRISQPYIVALMTEQLELKPSDRVLEIGTGSGYQAAVLGEIAGEVNTVEVIPELARHAEETLAGLDYAQVHVHIGDGSIGWSEAAPYDKILVAAAAPEVPQALFDQLKDGGRLVIPVGDRRVQHLEVWNRQGQEFIRQVSLPVYFVPLRGRFGWK